MIDVLKALGTTMLAVATAGALAAEPGGWFRLPPLPDREGFAGGFAGTSGGALLFAGGANVPGEKWGREFVKVWYDGIWLLDAPTGAWRAVGRLPERRAYGGSINLPEGLLCIGGSSMERHTADVVMLTWDGRGVRQVAWPALPKPCAMCGAALVGRGIYVVGGTDRPEATRPLDTCWLLDLDDVAAGWQPLPACPGGPRILPVVAAAEDGLFVCSGADLAPGADGRPLRTYRRDAWRYRRGGGWERLADLPRPAVAAPSPAIIAAGEILVVCGDDGMRIAHEPLAEHPGFPRDTLRYRVQEDRWSVESGLPFSVVTAPVVTWQGMAVVVSGEMRPRVRTPDVWAMMMDGREAGR